MQIQLEQVISLYQFPTGRAIFAVRACREVAIALGEDGLAARCDDVLAAARAAQALEVRHRRVGGAAPRYGPAANALDVQIDRTLAALRDTIAARVALIPPDAPDDPADLAARRLDDELFPRGLAFVTSLNYVEEHAWVEGLLSRLLPGGDLAAEVDLLALHPFTTRLADINARFGEALRDARERPTVTWDAVRAARALAQRSLIRLVVATLARFIDDDDTPQRSAVLAPIFAQQDAIAAAYKARRGLRDVDPDSGLVTDPDAPA